jgi:hypothetical protein
MWPTLDFTVYFEPRIFVSVFAFVGDSTMTSVLSEEPAAEESAVFVFGREAGLFFVACFFTGFFESASAESVFSEDAFVAEVFDEAVFFGFAAGDEGFFFEALFGAVFFTGAAVPCSAFAAVFPPFFGGAEGLSTTSASVTVFLRTMRKNRPQQRVQLEG